ncbi:Trihelix transcription factor GT-3b, partial [Frankliniella fusca]
MSAGQGLVKFNVYDNNGDLYSVLITEQERKETEGDAARTLRLLNRLKAAGLQPCCKWDESVDASSDADLSEWLPQASRATKPPQAAQATKSAKVKKPAQATHIRGEMESFVPPSSSASLSGAIHRASGKSGAKWGKERTEILLDVCIPYAEQLRVAYLPKEFWQHISDILFAMDPVNLNYSHEQLREKMRLLKGYHSQKERGKHGKTDWEHMKKMNILFPKSTDDTKESTCEMSMSHGLADMHAIGYRNAAVFCHQPGNGPKKGHDATTEQPSSSATGSVAVDLPSMSILGSMSDLVHEDDNTCEPITGGLGGIHVEDYGGCDDEPFLILDVPSISGYETMYDDLGTVPLKSAEKSTSTLHEVTFNSRRSVGQSSSPNITDVNGSVSKCLFDVPTLTDTATLDCASGRVKQHGSNLDSSLEIMSSSGACQSRHPSVIGVRTLPCMDSLQNLQSEVVELHGNKDPHLGNNSTYSHFNNSMVVASTPSGSPAKKKSSSGPVYSPRKAKLATPKRKIGAIHLIWSEEVTEKFLDVCISKKDSLRKQDIPPNIWKEIGCELRLHGIEKEWQVLRSKYENMDRLFKRILESNGKLNGIPWTHYGKFCLIYDIADDFEILKDVEEDQLGTPRRTKQLWKEERERLLICLYAERKAKFDSTKCPVRHSILYNEIAEQMNLYDVPVNAKQCKAHMGTLLDLFRSEYDRCNKSGEGAPQFRFYDDMMNIFKGCPTLEAPVSISIGRGLALSRKGVKETEAKQNSRTRPKLDLQKPGGSKSNKTTNQYSTLKAAEPTKPAEVSVAEE